MLKGLNTEIILKIQSYITYMNLKLNYEYFRKYFFSLEFLFGLKYRLECNITLHLLECFSLELNFAVICELILQSQNPA